MALIAWTASPREARRLLEEHCRYQQVEYAIAHLDHSPLHALGRAPGPGDVLLGMGGKVLKMYQAAGIVPKNRALGSQRGKVFTSPSGVPSLFTFDPAICFREADKAQEILWDANLAIRLGRTGSLAPQVGDYQWGTLAEVRAHVCAEIEREGYCLLSLDLETHGLYPWYDDKQITTSQWTWADGRSIVVDHTKHTTPLPEPKSDFFAGGAPARRTSMLPVGFANWDELLTFAWLVQDPRIRLWGANLKYDAVWIRTKWGIEIANFTFDTTLGGSLVDENRSNSLNNHTKIYVPELGGYDDHFNQIADKAEMPTELAKRPNEFLTYSGGDSDATRRVGLCIQGALRSDWQLCRFYQKILHPAARAFERIEQRGLLVDPAKFEEIRIKVQADIDRCTHDAMMAIPLKVRAKHAEDLKLSRPTLLRDAFFSPEGYGLKPSDKFQTEKTKQPQTSMDHFKLFMDTPAKPLIENLDKLGSAKKTMSTYIVGFLKHLRPDNHFHPTYALHHGGLFDGGDGGDSGTVSGRLAAKEPAIQTLPKHTSYAKLLRTAYIAPEGYEFWECDFSQGELRMTACLADEANMIAAYLKGIDLHAITAAELNGYDLATFLALKQNDPKLFKVLRQGGKAGNFGLIYGMGAPGFVAYAYKQYGVVVSLKDAVTFRDKFLYQLWPRLPEWHEESIEHARQWRAIRNPLGRIRHLPLIDSPHNDISAKAERQAINSPVQGALNDIALYLVALTEQRYGDCEDEFSVRGSTHDALYGYVKIGQREKWMERVTSIVEEMHTLFQTEFDWEPQLTFPVDWSVGPNWGEMVELEA